MNKEPGTVSSMLTDIPSGIKEYSLKFLADGQVTIRDEQVGETFHPVIGAMKEARQLYVDQTFLAECWKEPGTTAKCVWDVGLGAAANAAAVFESWSKGSFGDLYLESFDQNRGALSFALQHCREYPDSLGYLKKWDWEAFMKNNAIHLQQGARIFSWRFHEGDFRAVCNKPELHRPDLIMYDMYSAPKSPRLYSMDQWELLKDRVGEEGSVIVLHTRSTVVRVTLALAGWYVGTGTRLGDKEETTLAASKKELLKEPLGLEWLEKVKRSTSASPITGEEINIAPIPAHWFERLARHPQWTE